MCELLGICAKAPVDVHGYLKSFYSHSVHHPHGWGLMREQDGQTEIIKEPVCATGSRIISTTIRKTKPQTHMLAHIRLATVGAKKYNNCHPYTGFDTSGRQWTLIHNGTIYSGVQLAKYLSKQAGDTDSERVFLYMLDEINREIMINNAPLSAEQRWHIIDKIAITLSPRNKFNFMIYDGEFLYVHKNMKDTLVYKALDEGFVFSTQPVDDGEWSSFPMTQVLAYSEGKCVFEGTVHKHEFVPTLDYITALDAMNI